jgi:hypothetical protein
MCERGKFSSIESKSICLLCDEANNEFSDLPGSTTCKLCPPDQISIGKSCASVAVDDTLPVPTSVTIKRINANDFKHLTIEWECAAGYDTFTLHVSTNPNFPSSNETKIIKKIRQKYLSIQTLNNIDIRNAVH